MTVSILPGKLTALRTALIEYLNEKTSNAGAESDLHGLFEKSIGKLVTALLKSNNFAGYDESVFGDQEELHRFEIIAAIPGGMDIYEIAQCYEHLCGLGPNLDSNGNVSFKFSQSRRRNHGMFYTPAIIARRIVSLSLDALGFTPNNIQSRLEVLDPAVGAGIFLTEFLLEISKRIKGSEINDPCHRLDSIFSLHGVDIDPVAIQITRAAMVQTLGVQACGDGLNPQNIRVGNSLVGDDGKIIQDQIEMTLYDPNHETGNTSTDKRRSRDSWFERRKGFNWSHEFPHIFDRENPGFDLIIGNPPYEILSVKESGIPDLEIDLDYFRSRYETCSGKINTYRLMMERCVNLLRRGGGLGLVVPATFLADSTASVLRKKVFLECEVVDLITIPEKAKVFQGVTQALSIIIARKGKPSTTVRSRVWGAEKSFDGLSSTRIQVDELKKTGFRIPILRSQIESDLLNHLGGFSCLGSKFPNVPRIKVHQGEINLTTNMEMISKSDTGIPLVRGEHIHPFSIRHPSAQLNRMDWIRPETIKNEKHGRKHNDKSASGMTDASCNEGRVALARVVNLDCQLRLKAAWVREGVYLGDMTNYLDRTLMSRNFTLGLLNSKLLNWRFKITSANNYISASELELLPVPSYIQISPGLDSHLKESGLMEALMSGMDTNLHGALSRIDSIIDRIACQQEKFVYIRFAIEEIVDSLIDKNLETECAAPFRNHILLVLDALVIKLYSAEKYYAVLDMVETW